MKLVFMKLGESLVNRGMRATLHTSFINVKLL